MVPARRLPATAGLRWVLHVANGGGGGFEPNTTASRPSEPARPRGLHDHEYPVPTVPGCDCLRRVWEMRDG